MPDPAPPFAGQTLGAARRALQSVLSGAGVDNASREARLLVEYATGLRPEEVLRDEARIVSTTEAQHLSEVLARRLAHEPISRIRGEREFYGRAFAVSPAVLDPRPETETLIDLVLQWVDETGGRNRPLTLIDVGTGSGCILVTLLAELPSAEGLGTDVSASALGMARANALRHAVAARARFEECNALNGVAGPFDILVSNPPYIPSTDIPALDPGVRRFDPMTALDGGRDGLDVYRAIATRAGKVVPSGLIAVEVGAGQAAEVAGIFGISVENRAGAPWTRADLGGHDRTVALLTQR